MANVDCSHIYAHYCPFDRWVANALVTLFNWNKGSYADILTCTFLRTNAWKNYQMTHFLCFFLERY